MCVLVFILFASSYGASGQTNEGQLWPGSSRGAKSELYGDLNVSWKMWNLLVVRQ